MNVNPEQEVYQLIYDDVDNYHYYGRSNHGKDSIKHILSLKPDSIIDVGCGHNHFIQIMRELGVEKAVGIDFACKSADYVCDILDLPFKDKEFDFLTAWDVLEHLLPEQVDQALKEMSRISKRFAFTITYNPASTPPPTRFKGHNLHQCCRQPAWWMEQIEKYAISCNNTLAYWNGYWK
jgi:ubiquinone/menaquinone biosynthesis C-methylase UbiE